MFFKNFQKQKKLRISAGRKIIIWQKVLRGYLSKWKIIYHQQTNSVDEETKTFFMNNLDICILESPPSSTKISLLYLWQKNEGDVDIASPPLRNPIKKHNHFFTVPIGIRPELQRTAVEIIIWGVRNMRPFNYSVLTLLLYSSMWVLNVRWTHHQPLSLFVYINAIRIN